MPCHLMSPICHLYMHVDSTWLHQVHCPVCEDVAILTWHLYTMGMY